MSEKELLVEALRLLNEATEWSNVVKWNPQSRDQRERAMSWYNEAMELRREAAKEA